MTEKEASEDLGAPVAYLVLKDGTPVYDRSGARVGDVEHVLADEQSDVFHGLIIDGGQAGHRFAGADQIDGLFEHGVIVAKPAAELPEPSAGQADESLLSKAWEWLVQPK